MKKIFEPINIFDFDGTLTTDTWPKCWTWINKYGYEGRKRNEPLQNAIREYREKHAGDPINTFFDFFNDVLKINNTAIDFKEFIDGENYIKYSSGVVDYLANSKIKKYIISGNFSDFLKSLKIGQYFNGIYGSNLLKNSSGQIIGFGDGITNDKKVEAIKVILKENNRTQDNCKNVYYIGDGYSDEVAMKFVHNSGGKSIFVYQRNGDKFSKYNDEIYNKLNAEGIVDFYCVADYKKNRELYNILERKNII